MNLTVKMDANINFWELHPQLKLFVSFKELYQKDKSKNKEQSSNIMWGIAFLLETGEHNKLRNLSEDDRKDIIEKDYIKDKNFKWENVKDVIEDYKKFALSPAERELIEWNSYMEKRAKVLDSESLDIDNIEKIDKIRLNTKKLYDDYKRIMEDMAKDAVASKNKGGVKLSPSEQGLL